MMLGNGSNAGDSSTAKEIFISDSLFNAAGGPGGVTTAIHILGSEHVRLDNCHIDTFLYGILIAPGPYGSNALRHTFTAVTIYGCTSAFPSGGYMGAAVLIQPQASETQQLDVGQIEFTSCLFEPGKSFAPTEAGPIPAGVVIDATNGTIDTVRLISCYSARWAGPGLYVIGAGGGPGPYANNIEILGGMYAGNNYTVEGGYSASQPYGIYVGNGAQYIRIVGTSCIGEYRYITIGKETESPHQGVGVYVDGGASNVILGDCDVTENATNGITVNGSTKAVANVFIRDCNASGAWAYNTAINVSGAASNLSNIEVTDCAGYNDLNVELSTTGPGNNHNFNGVTYGYYGPVVFYTNSGGGFTISAIQIQGYGTHLTSGAFTLPPGSTPYATITYSGAGLALPFLMIGQ
ncbi:MAG: hypothetical protein JOZ77_00685 [Candidatus Eremiobacteraeota bacterium]|nr:hypothetical protein [Candidatus Eremiobacteraeota bacterium]